MNQRQSRYISGLYFLYFCAVGVLLPFLPIYLQTRDLNAWEIGLVQAMGPVFYLFLPPIWSRWAEKTGRIDILLRMIGVGALTGLSFVLLGHSAFFLWVGLFVYSSFVTALVPLLDSLAIEHVRRHGGAYARLRLFGSLGFVASSALFGASFPGKGTVTIIAPLLFLGAYTLLTWGVHSTPPSAGQGDKKTASFSPLRNRTVVILLAATSLHWVASAPYHGMFSLHAASIGLPSLVLGLSSSLAVLSEVVVMFLYPRWAVYLSARTSLLLSFVFSAIRWWGLAHASTPWAVISLNLLHGMTFGLFYVSAVQILSEHVEPQFRASAQAWLVSMTFGFGGLVGFAFSGVGFHHLKGHGLFQLATFIQLIPLALALALPSSGAKQREHAAW